jgi:hypothetical protein
MSLILFGALSMLTLKSDLKWMVNLSGSMIKLLSSTYSLNNGLQAMKLSIKMTGAKRGKCFAIHFHA